MQNERRNTTWKKQEYNILINLTEVVRKVVKCLHPLQNSVNRRAVVGTVMKFQMQ